MPTVAMADLQPGAVLSQAVYSPRGILLAPAGTMLTDTHLSIFQSWGVLEVAIEGDDGEAPVEASAEVIASMQQMLDDRFSLVVPLYPFMREVRRVTEQLLLQRLTRDASQDQ